ncbi:hypothetical protein [Streptomyces sp. VRA16 Mangrove soil]|uniref:MmyB family transcriptional regulator n=1 Tax=Streptomyces sp. VRA16 Mangrove soil TaxID=2817434 RepID=UPI0035AC1487
MKRLRQHHRLPAAHRSRPRAPGDTELTGLIGELATRRDEFRTAWTNTTSACTTPAARHRHPAVGEITLDVDAMQLPGDAGPTLTAYSAKPGRCR